MKEYDDLTLQLVQKTEFGILKEFCEICEANGFKYYIDSGSLLGAIRHKGFIPWDDDIDVAMPREDYAAFLDYAKANLTEKYNILNIFEYDNYPVGTTELSLKGTVFVVDSFKDLTNIPFGIYLDIFPMDYVSDNCFIRNIQIIRTYILGKLMILSSLPKPAIHFNPKANKAIHVATSFIYCILKLVKASPRRIYKKMMRIVSANKTGTNKILYLHSQRPGGMLLDWDDAFPTVPLSFCGMTVQAPRAYDKYMTQLYGDYMTLPPENKRRNHYPYKLDLGDYAK